MGIINQVQGNVRVKLLGPILDQKMWQGLILLASAGQQNPDVSKFQSCVDLFSHGKAPPPSILVLPGASLPAQTSSTITLRALLKFLFRLRSHYFPPRPVNIIHSSKPTQSESASQKKCSLDHPNLNKMISAYPHLRPLVCPEISFMKWLVCEYTYFWILSKKGQMLCTIHILCPTTPITVLKYNYTPSLSVSWPNHL